MPPITTIRSAARAALVGLATFGIVLGSLVFAQSDQASRVAADAIGHTRLQQAAASAAAARADIVISLAAASEEIRESALDDALLRISGLTELDLGAATRQETESIAKNLQAFAVELRRDGAESADALGAGLIRDLADLAGGLITRAAQLEGAILAESTSAGDTARAASVFVALLAPGLAVFALHRASRSRLERVQLTAELEREQAIAAVQTNLISGLSHELRTPLTGIAGFAEALLEFGSSDRDLVDEASQIIYSESNELQRMVEDMLVASRASTGSLAYSEQSVDAGGEVDKVVEPFRRSGESIDTDVAPATWTVDRLRVRHILRNLVSNAVRHGRSPILIEGRIVDDRYEVAVIDHGDGFDGVDLERLRTGFVHAGDSATVAGSIGLGFAVATTLAAGMGSELLAERRNGATRVSLTIPMAGVAAYPGVVV